MWLSRFAFGYLVTGIVIGSLPLPEKIAVRSRWETDKTRREFAGWARTLSAFGTKVEAEDLDAVLWPVARVSGAAIRELRRPYDFFTRATGFFQSWRMFSSPNTRSVARLVVELDAGDGRWKKIHVSRSSRYRWRRWQLDHQRLRKLVARAVRHPERDEFPRLARWLARQAANDYPEAAAVRVTAEQAKLTTPEAWRAGSAVILEGVAERRFELEPFR